MKVLRTLSLFSILSTVLFVPSAICMEEWYVPDEDELNTGLAAQELLRSVREKLTPELRAYRESVYRYLKRSVLPTCLPEQVRNCLDTSYFITEGCARFRNILQFVPGGELFAPSGLVALIWSAVTSAGIEGLGARNYDEFRDIAANLTANIVVAFMMELPDVQNLSFCGNIAAWFVLKQLVRFVIDEKDTFGVGPAIRTSSSLMYSQIGMIAEVVRQRMKSFSDALSKVRRGFIEELDQD